MNVIDSRTKRTIVNNILLHINNILLYPESTKAWAKKYAAFIYVDGYAQHNENVDL